MKTNITFPNKNFIVFDFETTGVLPLVDQVIEISAMKFVNGVKQMPFDCLLKVPGPLPKVITDLTKITDEMLEKDGKDPEKVWKEFAMYIQDFPLIGHNIINFDRIFLEEAFKKYELPLPGSYRYIDTAMLYKGRKVEQGQRWYESHFAYCKRISELRAPGVYFKLILCCDELGIDRSTLQAHRAKADIEMTFQVYKKLMSGAEIRTKQPVVDELKKKIAEQKKRAHIDALTDKNGQIRVDEGG